MPKVVKENEPEEFSICNDMFRIKDLSSSHRLAINYSGRRQ